MKTFFFFRDHLDFGHELGKWLILTESLFFRETSQNFWDTCKPATVPKGYRTTKSLGNPGLKFCLPPTNVKREEVFAEFEILFAQLLHHKPKSIDELRLLKAKLNELAHSFCGSPIDVTKFPLILTVSKQLSLYVLINTF